jgi:hypothetical protein
MQTVDLLINKLISWVDIAISFITSMFGSYSAKYSQLLVYGLLIFLVAKMLKIKVDVGVGKGK